MHTASYVIIFGSLSVHRKRSLPSSSVTVGRQGIDSPFKSAPSTAVPARKLKNAGKSPVGTLLSSDAELDHSSPAPSTESTPYFSSPGRTEAVYGECIDIMERFSSFGMNPREEGAYMPGTPSRDTDLASLYSATQSSCSIIARQPTKMLRIPIRSFNQSVLPLSTPNLTEADYKELTEILALEPHERTAAQTQQVFEQLEHLELFVNHDQSLHMKFAAAFRLRSFKLVAPLPFKTFLHSDHPFWFNPGLSLWLCLRAQGAVLAEEGEFPQLGGYIFFLRGSASVHCYKPGKKAKMMNSDGLDLWAIPTRLRWPLLEQYRDT